MFYFSYFLLKLKFSVLFSFLSLISPLKTHRFKNLSVYYSSFLKYILKNLKRFNRITTEA